MSSLPQNQNKLENSAREEASELNHQMKEITNQQNDEEFGDIELKRFKQVDQAHCPESWKDRNRITSLGVKKHENIKLRLKDGLVSHLLRKEQVIETSYMLDLQSMEINLYTSLLIQFTFICFFSPFFIGAGAVSYFINIGIIYLLIHVYSTMARRPISRRESSIGIWNSLISVIGYLGILYNAVVLIKTTDGLEVFRGSRKTDVCENGLLNLNKTTDTEIIDRVQFLLLIFKFVFSLIAPKLPGWIEKKLTRERLTQNRIRKDLTKTVSRIGIEYSKRKDGKFDERIFNDKESQALKRFFKNEKPIQGCIKPPGKEFGEFDIPKIIVKKKRTDLI